ncbi:MAG: nucleoside hydrolase [Roseiflexaceae bacterium]
MKRVILDTDIGTDVDDCLALALLLASPEIELVGVTCVYGHVQIRAQMVETLLHLHGSPHIPIALGAESTLLGLRSIYWPGHEGHGLLSPNQPPARVADRDAVDFLIETILANPGEIWVLAIGPLTNIALALRKAPQIAKHMAGLMIMGGVIRGPGRFDLPVTEHNIVCDPEAALVVFQSGAPITLVPLDVTTQVRIYPAGVEQIRAGGSTYHQAVADQVALYPPFGQRGYTFLHDPLAAGLLCDPSFAELIPLQIEIETTGRITSGATIARAPREQQPANALVALRVDTLRFESFLIERLRTPLA